MEIKIFISDRLIVRARQLLRRKKSLFALIFLFVISLSSIVYATMPYLFSSGAVISSANVNSNFAALETTIAAMCVSLGGTYNGSTRVCSAITWPSYATCAWRAVAPRRFGEIICPGNEMAKGFRTIVYDPDSSPSDYDFLLYCCR